MKMYARPVAYIRKSTQGTRESKADQIANVRDLIERTASDDLRTLLVLDGDWGISAARDKTAKRLDFLRLLEMVEAGEVSTLYAAWADRLARSVQWAARLLDAAEIAGTTIVTNEGRFAPNDDQARMLFHFGSMQNESFVRLSERKAAARTVRRRARGDKMGMPFYGNLPGEDHAAVLAAFDEVGSANGAARLLNERGVPTRRGGVWTQPSVRQILVRVGKMPKLGTRGAKPYAAHRLYRLLRCHCGRILSGVVNPGRTGKHPATIYRCVNAAADPNHGKKSVTERQLMPWIRAEADRLQLDFTSVTMAEEVNQERAGLDAKRDRIVDMFADGTIDKAARDSRLAVVDADLERVAATAQDIEVDLEPVDWTKPPKVVNAVLRAMWRHIDLDATMQPVSAEWRVPEWRAA